MVILAECAHADADLLAELNAGGAGFVCPTLNNQRFRLAVRNTAVSARSVQSDPSERLLVVQLRSFKKRPLLLAVVHLPSLLGANDSVGYVLAEELRRTETRLRNQRTILVGDFNRSPFDDVVVDALGFHALMTRQLTERKHNRTVQGHEYPVFFNPMWQFLTDRATRPPGTYYFDQSVALNHFWYTLDQVMVRPELADKLNSVEILETDGTDSLLNTPHGWPDTTTGSDHLPLLFRIDW